jgi:hypothetical protein
MTGPRKKNEAASPADFLWGLAELVRYARNEEPEVRGWAAARLLQQFPERCVDAVAPMVLDDAGGLAERAAVHVGRFGSQEHRPVLERGVKQGREGAPGACLEALAALGDDKIEELGASALRRRELNDEEAASVLAVVVRRGEFRVARQIALSEIGSRPAMMAQPQACRALFSRLPHDDMPSLMQAMLAALAWSGAERAVGAFHALSDALELEDTAWLLHTDRKRRIDLPRTLKVYDATYDTEVRQSLGSEAIAHLAEAFRDGSLPAVAAALVALCDQRATGLGAGDDDLPARIRAAVQALGSPDVLEDVERLGPPAVEPAILTLLSCGLKLASYRPLGRELHAASGDQEALLDLARVESGCLLEQLPQAIEDVVRSGAPRRRVVLFAAEMLGRRGPWYGRMMALELLARVRGVEEVHEVLRCLDDESHHIVEAAGRALERLGADVVPAVQAARDIGTVDAVALEWMVAGVCQAGTNEALAFILANLDDLVVELDAGFVCEWASVLGAQELIPRFRALLDEDLARVGHALLLVSAIHDRPVPEEESILQAIEHSQHPEPGHGDPEGGSGEGGNYLM